MLRGTGVKKSGMEMWAQAATKTLPASTMPAERSQRWAADAGAVAAGAAAGKLDAERGLLTRLPSRLRFDFGFLGGLHRMRAGNHCHPRRLDAQVPALQVDMTCHTCGSQQQGRNRDEKAYQ